MSNTTQRRENNMNRKKRFVQFTRILMALLERVDPVLHLHARALIHDCEQRKRCGEVPSVTEALKRPLKDIVGPKYWRLAREREKEANIHHLFHLDVEPLNVADEPPPLGEDDLSRLLDNLRDVDAPRTGSTRHFATNAPNVDDLKTRKKRLWMIICILMKYLDQTDKDLYYRAKTIVSDCVRRHRNNEEGYRSLSGSIQASLKNEIGSEYWRRAERYVAKSLLNRTESSSTMNGATQHHSIMKKRTIDGVRVHFEEKRPRRVWEI
jgi:hypothetical protein